MTDREELIAELRGRCWCLIYAYDCSKCDEDLPSLCRSERELFKAAADMLEADAEKGMNVPSEPSGNSGQFKWISVDDELPEDDVQVLACTKHGKAFSAHCEKGEWRVSHSVKITHWMPLPKPPKED